MAQHAQLAKAREVFEARARDGDERLRDELQALDAKQAKVDGLLKHQWRVCRW